MLFELMKSLFGIVRPRPVELTLQQRLIALHIRSASP